MPVNVESSLTPERPAVSSIAAPLTPSTDPARGGKALTVAQVVSRIRALIEREFPTPLWIEGEASNCTYHASGHIYFSLVDEQVTDRFGQRLVLPCAFFKNANQYLKFKLTDGLKVLCLGQVTTYEGRGQYQLKVFRVEPKGIGALQLAFEQLKKKLAAEGLFDEARKRPIPRLPRRIGVITSRSGSAIHDIVSKLRGRFDIMIIPVKVQGEGAAQEIAGGIEIANRLRLAEVLIVGRGGGSVEDLWAFNEETVARAIVRSHIPVISAVGHQDDWTIADYAADLRASTPTDAAKWLVNEQQQVMDRSRDLIDRLVESTQLFLDDYVNRLDALCGRLRLLHPLHQLERWEQRVHELQGQAVLGMRHALDREHHRLTSLAGRLQALSPLAVLARGYSITFRALDCSVLTDASRIHPGEGLETRLARGIIRSTVTSTDVRDQRD
ncbi:MAG: exodeoxyribonuclease VII large subunit [Candidatus Omnitrophica bacterium]|nr:exodeoxyribonuclease VII large subunit [Candidatus Omnitrophota bacterium]